MPSSSAPHDNHNAVSPVVHPLSLLLSPSQSSFLFLPLSPSPFPLPAPPPYSPSHTIPSLSNPTPTHLAHPPCPSIACHPTSPTTHANPPTPQPAHLHTRPPPQYTPTLHRYHTTSLHLPALPPSQASHTMPIRRGQQCRHCRRAHTLRLCIPQPTLTTASMGREKSSASRSQHAVAKTSPTCGTYRCRSDRCAVVSPDVHT